MLFNVITSMFNNSCYREKIEKENFEKINTEMSYNWQVSIEESEKRTIQTLDISLDSYNLRKEKNKLTNNLYYFLLQVV